MGYGTMLLNLSSYDFKMLMNVLKNECDIDDLSVEENAKTIVIPTSSQETYMIFTKKEASRLLAILEEADNEVKTEQLLSLFQ
ncbi:hypothetical protein A9P82_09440 [Arachidicoccus ginsenosidimutans]|nr:hypothetical protein A9P82_09440 [Arachidicoccus sp. BS20]